VLKQEKEVNPDDQTILNDSGNYKEEQATNKKQRIKKEENRQRSEHEKSVILIFITVGNISDPF
jgi:hypothetical protein